MAIEETQNKMLSVADRFGFFLAEIEGMSLKKLRFWYNGSIKLYENERKLMGLK